MPKNKNNNNKKPKSKLGIKLCDICSYKIEVLYLWERSLCSMILSEESDGISFHLYIWYICVFTMQPI